MLPPQTPLHRVAPLARRAESLGYDFLGCGEHVFFHAPTPNAFVALAAAAGATERIRLVSALTLLPTYPAALAAKMAATLHGVSGGRFELGIGVGGEYPSEIRACGFDPKTRGAYVDESLEVITALFTGEKLTHAGRFITIDGERLDPAPGTLPIWVGGRKPAAERRAGRFADHWMPYLMTPDQMGASLSNAREHAAAAGRAPEAVQGAYFAWSNVGKDGDEAKATGIRVLSALYGMDMAPVADKYLVLGDARQVAERFAAYAAAGATSLVFAPCCPDEQADAVIETFIAEVAPAVRAAAPSSPELPA